MDHTGVSDKCIAKVIRNDGITKKIIKNEERQTDRIFLNFISQLDIVFRKLILLDKRRIK